MSERTLKTHEPDWNSTIKVKTNAFSNSEILISLSCHGIHTVMNDDPYVEMDAETFLNCLFTNGVIVQ